MVRTVNDLTRTFFFFSSEIILGIVVNNCDYQKKKKKVLKVRVKSRSTFSAGMNDIMLDELVRGQGSIR